MARIQIMRPQHRVFKCLALMMVVMFASVARTATASDHADTDRLIQAGRHDARIADFYVFVRGSKLVMAMTLVGASPEPTEQFRFRSDVVYRFLIDRAATVRFDDAEQVRMYGGAVANPAEIKEDVVVEVRFAAEGATHNVSVSGLHQGPDASFAVFAGLRDEPFIRSTVIGKNIIAIVVELPLRKVVAKSDPPVLLAWATTDVVGFGDEQDDLGGRAYRSMFPDGHGLNTVHPSLHTSTFNVASDVVIFDTNRPARFPNGRDLPDDVVDFVGRQDGAPFPSANDVPFSDEFPYLAPPQ